MVTHIYAGARNKHNIKDESNDLWFTADAEKYLSIMKKYKSKITLEIGAHDHWQDVRYIDDVTGPYRSLFIPTGMSMQQGQMPGYNTLDISDTTGVASNIRETSMDITATYGKTTVPALDDIPLYHLSYKDYGINELTPEAIKAGYAQLKATSFEHIETFLSDKEGFDASNANLFAQGKDLLAGWGLINISTKSTKHFFC